MTYNSVDDMVLFLDKVKWRFVNLNEAFAKTFKQTPRTLYVYSNIGESVIVGNSKTDLLREVPYNPEKRVSFYEPDQEWFVKVRNRSFEVCEINVCMDEVRTSISKYPKGTYLWSASIRITHT